jgi:hypothetical protein
MIPFNLKDKNSETTLQFNLPSSWQEITLGQMIDWEHESSSGPISLCKQLEILTGIEEQTWLNCSILSLDKMLLPYLEWMKEPVNELDFAGVPDSVVIDGETIPVPKNIELKSFGQYITFKMKMEEAMKKNDKGELERIDIDFIPLAIAIYLYPESTFDDIKAAAFAIKVRELPFIQANTLSTFFFQKFLNLENETVNSYTTSRTVSSYERV